jgi:hypothetical protein
MAGLQTFYVPSRAKGKSWKVYFHKPKGSPSYVAAVEGELKDGLFSHPPMTDRHIMVQISGRATRGAVASAGCELLRQMTDNSYILADHFADFAPCFD